MGAGLLGHAPATQRQDAHGIADQDQGSHRDYDRFRHAQGLGGGRQVGQGGDGGQRRQGGASARLENTVICATSRALSP